MGGGRTGYGLDRNRRVRDELDGTAAGCWDEDVIHFLECAQFRAVRADGVELENICAIMASDLSATAGGRCPHSRIVRGKICKPAMTASLRECCIGDVGDHRHGPRMRPA